MSKSPRAPGRLPPPSPDTTDAEQIARLQAENERLRAENERVRAENGALLEQNRALRKHIDGGDTEEPYDARDDEIAFLRRRLAIIRQLVSGPDGTVAAAPAPVAAAVVDSGPTSLVPTPLEGSSGRVTMASSASSFPGVKLRSDTVLQKSTTKLAIKPLPAGDEPKGDKADKADKADKKKGSRLFGRK